MLLFVLTLLSGCDWTGWTEVDPGPCVEELVEVYGLPLPVSQPQIAVYRAATQPLGRGEFIVIRADITQEISEKIEESLAQDLGDRAPAQVIDYIIPANRSLNWWPAAGTFQARKYSAKPKGLDTLLLEVFVVQGVTEPYILFVMTPKAAYTHAMNPSVTQ